MALALHSAYFKKKNLQNKKYGVYLRFIRKSHEVFIHLQNLLCSFLLIYATVS
jgi:hypothetical protein